MKYILTSILLILAISATSLTLKYDTVSAHRSGCHRWHSCPSDSGSYTCGDTGYYSQCGSSTYVAPTVNYTAQGKTGGIKQANDAITTINESAEAAGSQDGQTDGEKGALEYAKPSSSAICNQNITWDTTQDASYESAYKSAYQSQCNDLYSTSFRQAYASSYSLAKEQYTNRQAKSNSDSSNIWGMILLGGIAVAILYSVVSNTKND